jgi:putative sterol carrier protein
VREAYEFRVGKDIFHVRMDDGVSEPEYGPAFEPDPVVRTAPDTFLSLVSGRLEPADAIGLGRLDVQGAPEAPRRVGEVFGVPMGVRLVRYRLRRLVRSLPPACCAS